jgi:hypothetical protein
MEVLTMAKKLIEHTYGSHIYMMLQLDSGAIVEIDVYFRSDGTHYRTSADNDPATRDAIIAAFNDLY